MLDQVADGVWVHHSELLANNATVVAGDSGVLVVDPGLTNAEVTCLAGDVRRLGVAVTAGFSTHPDWDHVLWHSALGGAPRYATARAAELMRELRSDPGWRERVVAGLPPEIVDDTPLQLFGLLTALPTGADELPWDGPEVRIIEHPAHAPGHAALLIEAKGVLVAGDMLSNVFVPMLDDFRGSNDPIGDYLVGLERLEEAADGVDVLVPGHGSVAAGEEVRERIARDRRYVLALRDGDEVDDPRIGPSAQPGWEWVTDIHQAQLRQLARMRQTPNPEA